MPSAKYASEVLIVPVYQHGKELPTTLMMTCDVASCFARPSGSSTKPDGCPLLPLLNTTTSLHPSSKHRIINYSSSLSSTIQSSAINSKHKSSQEHQEQPKILLPTTHSINTTISNSSCSSSQPSSRSLQQLPLLSPLSLAIRLSLQPVTPAM